MDVKVRKMGDLKGIEISDVLGLSQPLCKLIDTISCGLGKIYEPTNIKRLAKARSEEIRIISESVNDNVMIPVNFDDGCVSISSGDVNDLINRAQNRFLFQQLKKQQNIESTIEIAYKELENEESVSDTPVDDNWISSFFDFVANISDEQMQQIWGKLLAGEISNPGSFSIRTLDVLRKLNQHEAKLFEKNTPYILKCMGDKNHTFDDYFILKNAIEEVSCNITFPDIVSLNEAGLVTLAGDVAVSIYLDGNGVGEAIGQSHKLFFENQLETEIIISGQAYVLTASGIEIFSVLSSKNDEMNLEEYLNHCGEIFQETTLDLENLNENDFVFKVLKIN